MVKRTRVWLVAVTVVLFVAGVSGTSAGQQAQASADKAMNQAAVQRSWQVQAELARIEANKEAFIDELFGRWAPYLDPMVYDLWGSLKPLAMAATPWRLLGASLTTDFESGLRVLRGVVGPGWYVSAYIEGREPVLSAGSGMVQAGETGVGADWLGATGDSLVFTPIKPCRVVDTRNTGARTGMIPAGVANGRIFDFTQSGLTEGQGSQTAPCTGLPTENTKAWAVNITVTGYAAIGHLTVEPLGEGVSTTSFMNFFPTAYAVANAGAVTGCVGCVDSVYIHASTATHVIVDVTGYYSEAIAFATGTMTTLAGSSQVIPAGDYAWVSGAACPSGTVLVGGTQTNNVTGAWVMASDHSVSGTSWREYTRNFGASPATVTVSSRCMDVK